MDYGWFRTLWHEALEAASLLPRPPRPSETIDLHRMSRGYTLFVSLGSGHEAEPFYTTAQLEWTWDAELSARSATTEEDLLVQLLGQDGYDLVTEQPWLRVGVTLNATLPWGSPVPLPSANAWHHWVQEVTARLSPLFPTESKEGPNGLPIVLSAMGEPEARLRCGLLGRLYLTGVHLSAWQAMDLPREWDNPDREPDEWPGENLVDFAIRTRQALQTWEDCLGYLHPDELDTWRDGNGERSA
jgi:hypothetical protein